MSMPLIRRLFRERIASDRRNHQEGGYSLPLVLVVGIVLVAGAATLVSRSASIGFGAASQQQTWNARSIAELGMTTLVSRLNKEENRHLLAGPRNNPNYRRTLWSSANILQHINPCTTFDIQGNRTAAQQPTLSDILPSGGWWYVDREGRVSTNSGTAVGRFRLTTDQNGFEMGTLEALNIWSPTGKTAIRLSVIAEVLGSKGETKSRAILQQDLDVVPKCCNVTFGEDHGNNNYTRTYTPSNPFGVSQCKSLTLNPESFGIVFGTGGTGGTFSTGGKATDIYFIDPTTGLQVDIDPISCLDANLLDNNNCAITGQSGNQTGSYNGLTTTEEMVDQLDVLLPPAPSFYPLLAQTYDSSGYNTQLNSFRTGGNYGVIDVSCNPSNCTTISNIEQASTVTTFKFKLSGNNTIFINGNAQTGIPSFCRRYPDFSDPEATINPLHCVVSRLDTGRGSSKGNIQFATGIRGKTTEEFARPIYVYFADGNTTIWASTGSETVQHCVEPSLPTTNSADPESQRCRGDFNNYRENITRLSFFGCNPRQDRNGNNTIDINSEAKINESGFYYGNQCLSQTIEIQGNTSTAGFYAFFPAGNVNLTGSSRFEGVLWSQNIYSKGAGEFLVPSSGVADAFALLGIIPGPNDCQSSINGECTSDYEPKWDFVIRSVRRSKFTFI